MKIGAHISHTNAIPTLKTFGFNACQIFTISPRKLTPIKFDKKEFKLFTQRNKIQVYIHTSYMVNIWGEKPYHMHFCILQLLHQLEIGALGVVFHMPKTTPKLMVPALRAIIRKKPKLSKVILENRAVQPGPWSYETPEKLNALVKVFLSSGIAKSEIAFAIDTAHLHSCGITLRTYKDAKKWFAGLKYPELIKLIHLNGSMSSTYIDRHAIAFGPDDLIWNKTSYEDSGVKFIGEFCKKNNVDIIFECKDTHFPTVTRLMKKIT